MKGERIIAELLGILGMLAYGVMLQHLYSQLLNKPDESWLNQLRSWWVTRGSRKIEKTIRLTWSRPESSVEPTPGE